MGVCLEVGSIVILKGTTQVAMSLFITNNHYPPPLTRDLSEIA